MLMPLAYYGNPVLRKKAEPVGDVNDEVRQLVTDMIETLHHTRGLGLAAPQVNRSLAIFIIQVPEESDDGKSIPGELQVFINPKILKVSKDTWLFSEGCLSIPGLYAEVERPVSLVVEATDFQGNRFTKEYNGLQARVILHENDHINGVLFIDRIRGKQRQQMELPLRAIKKRYS